MNDPEIRRKALERQSQMKERMFAALNEEEKYKDVAMQETVNGLPREEEKRCAKRR